MCDLRKKRIVSYGRTIQITQFHPIKFYSAVEIEGAPDGYDTTEMWNECRADVNRQIALEYKAKKEIKDALNQDKQDIEQATSEKIEEEETAKKEKKIQNDKNSLQMITLIDGVPAFKLPYVKDKVAFQAQLDKFKDVAREVGIKFKWDDDNKRWLLLNMNEEDANQFVENLLGGYT